MKLEFILLLGLIAFFQVTKAVVPPGYVVDHTGVDHSLWDEVVTKCVHPDGKLAGIPLTEVDYVCVKEHPKYQPYLKQMGGANLKNLTISETYALFANAYNLFAMTMVIDHPCSKDIFGKCALRSITDVSLLPKVWFLKNFNFGGQKWSLDNVEYFMRGAKCPKEGGQCDQKYYPSNVPPSIPLKHRDFRLHAAIVCASISCPNIRNEAYFSQTLDEQFTANFNDFMSNKKKGLYVSDDGSITLSMIFTWFAGDFQGSYVVPSGYKGNKVLKFIEHYLYDTHPYKKDLKKAADENSSPSNFAYNWNLNAKKMVKCGSTGRKCQPLINMVLIGSGIGGGAILACCFICCLCCIMGCCCIVLRSRKKTRYVSLN